MTITLIFPAHLNGIVIRTFFSSALAALGLLFGLAPDYSFSRLTLGYSASAQEFNDQQLRRYAQVILSIESYRQQAFEEIQKIVDDPLPDIACNQPNSYRSLPADAQKIVNNYCRDSTRIVENSGLSVGQFNAITKKAQSDRNLEEEIQNLMIQLRR